MEQNTETLTDTIQENAEGTQAEAQTEETAATSQAAEESGNAEAQASTNEPFLVRYNHEDRELTHDEAVQYAQKGLKFDAVAPILDKLSFLAATSGKGAQQWLEEKIKAMEDDYRSELIDKYGDDEEVIELFLSKYKAENENKFSKFKNDKLAADTQAEEEAIKTVEGRIADGFLELQKEFPEITDISMLPKEVLEQGKKGKDLTDAYLRYKHQEQKRISAAKQTATENASASAGKMNGEADESDPLLSAFLKGLRN